MCDLPYNCVLFFFFCYLYFIFLLSAEINDQIRALHDELSNKAEVNLRQQEEITAFMGRCVSLETRIKKMTIENAELQSHLVAAQDAQRQLTTEVCLSVCLSVCHTLK